MTGDVSRGAPRKQKGKKHSHVWCAGAHLVLCFQNGGRVAQPRPAVHHVRLGWPMRAPAQHRSTLHSTNMSMGQEAVVMSCTSAATLQPGPFSELGGGDPAFRQVPAAGRIPFACQGPAQIRCNRLAYAAQCAPPAAAHAQGAWFLAHDCDTHAHRQPRRTCAEGKVVRSAMSNMAYA